MTTWEILWLMGTFGLALGAESIFEAAMRKLDADRTVKFIGTLCFSMGLGCLLIAIMIRLR